MQLVVTNAHIVPHRQVIEGWLHDKKDIQQLVSIQAQIELKHANLFALYQLVQFLDLPLQNWLQKEYKKLNGAALESVFTSIHQSFELPRSNFARIRVDLLSPSFQDKEFERMMQNKQFFTYTQDRLLKLSPLLVQTLFKLFEAFAGANCADIALLLATILCDVEYIRITLKRQPELVQSFINMLKQDAKYVFNSFCSFLVSVMRNSMRLLKDSL